MTMDDANQTGQWLLYDGDCPFCSRYVQYLKLQETLPHIHLLNAREADKALSEVKRAGLDINTGMVLKLDHHLYHGNECVSVLALLTTSSTCFNRLNRYLFSNPLGARIIYPLLVFGRRLTLLFTRRRMID